MQNRYTGDIGDYGKLGLLRCLKSFSIGVNWYLIPDETHNNDGQFISYLQDPRYSLPDSELYYALKEIVKTDNRRVLALENAGLIQAVFHSEVLDFTGLNRTQRDMRRQQWHRNALSRLHSCSIVFLDPDNGLMVPSAKGTRKANKYVEPTEIVDYYRQGSSVIYYQHKARYVDGHYTDIHQSLLNCCPGASGFGLKYKQTSIRYYFFILRPEHAEMAEKIVETMTQWQDYFKRM